MRSLVTGIVGDVVLLCSLRQSRNVHHAFCAMVKGCRSFKGTLASDYPYELRWRAPFASSMSSFCPTLLLLLLQGPLLILGEEDGWIWTGELCRPLLLCMLRSCKPSRKSANEIRLCCTSLDGEDFMLPDGSAILVIMSKEISRQRCQYVHTRWKSLERTNVV
jgi:hypothetical protein